MSRIDGDYNSKTKKYTCRTCGSEWYEFDGDEEGDYYYYEIADQRDGVRGNKYCPGCRIVIGSHAHGFSCIEELGTNETIESEHKFNKFRSVLWSMHNALGNEQKETMINDLYKVLRKYKDFT